MIKSSPDVEEPVQCLVAKLSGFTLHAGVFTKAHDRRKLERICRYIARPAVCEDRLSISPDGSILYRFTKPWADGTSALKLTAMEFIERLVALVPRPRVNLTRYHGVLALNYKYRKAIVPAGDKGEPQKTNEAKKVQSEEEI